MYNNLTTQLPTTLEAEFHTRPLTLLTRRETLNLAAYARRIADRGTTLYFIHEGNVDDWEVWQTEDGHHRVFPKFAVERSEPP